MRNRGIAIASQRRDYRAEGILFNMFNLISDSVIERLPATTK